MRDPRAQNAHRWECLCRPEDAEPFFTTARRFCGGVPGPQGGGGSWSRSKGVHVEPFLNGGDFDGMSGLGPLGHLFAVAFVAQPTTVKSAVPLLPVRVQLLATVTEPRFAPESATVAAQIAVFSVACH